MGSKIINKLPVSIALAVLAFGSATASAVTIGYGQTNLTSDIPRLAANTDILLKNPWGVSFSLTSPFWVSDQKTDVATLYTGAGVPAPPPPGSPLIVSIPPATGAPTGPTGQVFVGGMGFTTEAGASAVFVFSTLSGTIDAWNAGTSAVTQFTATDGAIYTGLAQAGSLLYAADNKNNKIDVFNNTFGKTTVSGTFTDPSVPSGFTPYDIQNVGGKLYVEYRGPTTTGGFVGVFDTNGNFLQNITDSHLNAPWGVTLAPAGFGQFGGDLLVGNFGDGRINAFNPVSGAFIGVLSDSAGNPIVNSGLWALDFRGQGSGIDANTLFFTAGINNQADGLFGAIQVAPEPATAAPIGLVLGISAFALLLRARNQRALSR
jgi:uncharacterized protein (TIGR03118 family)